MSRFIPVAKVGEVLAGKGRFVIVGDQRIALFFADGQYYALDDFCPHLGAPLWTGDVQQGLVICDRHMWAFDLKTGRSPDAPSLVAQTFPVRVVGEEIQIALPEERV